MLQILLIIIILLLLKVDSILLNFNVANHRNWLKVVLLFLNTYILIVLLVLIKNKSLFQYFKSIHTNSQKFALRIYIVWLRIFSQLFIVAVVDR